MEQTELRRRLDDLIRLEEAEVVDWPEVEDRCLALAEMLRHNEATYPDVVHHFVDDVDIRQKDLGYAQRQRGLVRRYVLTGEMVEHAPSVPIPAWALVPGLAVPALVLWLILR